MIQNLTTIIQLLPWLLMVYPSNEMFKRIFTILVQHLSAYSKQVSGLFCRRRRLSVFVESYIL